MIVLERAARNAKPVEVDIIDDCWVCNSHAGGGSLLYPTITVNFKTVCLHRFLYEKTYGKIPQGFVCRHTCNNPKCINPQHIIIGTQQDNINDRELAGNTARAEKHGNSLLSDEQVKEIYCSQDLGKILAKRFGVHKCTISAIKNGRNYYSITKCLVRGS